MKCVLLTALTLIIGTVVLVFGWFDSDSGESMSRVPVVKTPIVDEVADDNEMLEEQRYVAIYAEYKKLEKARRDLDRRLAHIKGIMWGVELPVAQAEDIVRKVRRGYELLKMKKLLGAFSSLESIRDERVRVEYAYQNLQGVIEEIKTAKSKI